MNNAEFDKIIAGSQFGRKKENPPSLKAARLHFVDGETNISECARQAGCSKQGARAAILRIQELIDNQGLVAVTVMVPKRNRKSIERMAAQMARGKKISYQVS